jgi:hypothetical protein
MFPATLDASRKKLRTAVSKGHRSENVTTSSDKSEKSTPGIKDVTVQPFGDIIFSTVSSVFYLHKEGPLCDQFWETRPWNRHCPRSSYTHFLCQNVGATCYFRNPATIFLLVLFWENRRIMYVRQLVLTSCSRSGSLLYDDDSSIHGPSESKYTNRNINIEA